MLKLTIDPGRRPRRRLSALGYLFGLSVLGFSLSLAAPHPGYAQDAFQAVPKATCGADDRQEAVQGETTMAERFAPGPAKAFNCNLQLMGQYKGDGSGWGMIVVGDCAVMSTYFDARRPAKMAATGSLLLDVADPANPKLISRLDSGGLRNVNESLDFSPARNLLFGDVYQFNQETEFPLDFYDMSDCRNPKLLSSGPVPQVRIYGGGFNPDGKIYYGTSCCGNWKGFDGPPSAIFAMDVSDPAHPKEITRWVPEVATWNTHWLSASPDGNRLYITLISNNPKTPTENGLVILDSSGVQAGKPNAQLKLVSSQFWTDTLFGEFNTNFTKDGKAYLLHTDMTGSFYFGGGVFEPAVCQAGRPNWGYGRIIDLSDEMNPKVVSRLALEVDDPARCAEIAHDPTLQGGYSAAFCDLDRTDNPRMMACGYMEGGLRVFDIRDLAAPKEIGYFKPPATRSEPSAGSPHQVGIQLPINTADSVVVPYFHNGGKEVWFNAMDNGFMAVRFSDAFIAANADLFTQ